MGKADGMKNVLRKLPISKQIYQKLDGYVSRIESQVYEIQKLSSQVDSLNEEKRNLENEVKFLKQAFLKLKRKEVSLKLHKKKTEGQPLKVVFLMEIPSVMKNMLSVIEELNADKRFEVVLVNLWYKVYNQDTYTYQHSDMGEIMNLSKYTVIDSYDENSNKWFDLESIDPDYVFFARPYDYYRNEAYHIAKVSEYAKTCYVPYGIQVIGGEVEKMVLTPECGELDYFFLDNKVRRDYITREMTETHLVQNGHVVYNGYPAMDMLLSHDDIKMVDDFFTVLWLPRWTTAENNCHFFEYKEVLSDYAKNHDKCRVILRPHPLCFEHFIQTGELTEAELQHVKQDYREPNMIDESGSYLEAFRDSAVLVMDETSLVAEYFLTDKPIVFCEKETHFSTLMKELIQGCYVVRNKEELLKVLDELRMGKDPLKEVRRNILKTTLLDYGESVAQNMKDELLKKDLL